MRLTDDLTLVDLGVDGGKAVAAEGKPGYACPLVATDVVKFQQAGIHWRAAVIPVKAAVCATSCKLDGIYVSHIPIDDGSIKGAHSIPISLRPVAHLPVVPASVSLSMAPGILGRLTWVPRGPGGAHKGCAWSAVVVKAILRGVVHAEFFTRLCALASGANLRGFGVRLHERSEAFRAT
ncbi:hypothetical protein ACI797_17730 [Geodermatophilus sp. SYSU D00691]